VQTDRKRKSILYQGGAGGRQNEALAIAARNVAIGKGDNYRGLVDPAFTFECCAKIREISLRSHGGKAVLKFLHKNTNIVAISLSFFTFGFVLGKGALDLTTGQEIILLIASAACGFEILMHSYSSVRRTALRGSAEPMRASSLRVRHQATNHPLRWEPTRLIVILL
jgi:hypothetical protein